MLNIVAIAFAVIGFGAPPVSSSSVQLSIRDGRVWLTTDHATIADVLAEWARVGRTQIVNSASLPPTPLTVELRDVPELEALAVITRATGGFMTVSRAAANGDEAATLSQFSRVVIFAAVPRSAFAAPPAMPAPSYGPAADVPPAIFTPSGAQRMIGPDGQPVPDDQEDAPPPPRRTFPTMPPGTSMPPGFSEPSDSGSPGRTAVPGVITPPAAPPRRPTSG